MTDWTDPVVHVRDCSVSDCANGLSAGELHQVTNHLRWPPLTQLCCCGQVVADLSHHYELADVALALCQMFSGVVYLDGRLGDASSNIGGRCRAINSVTASGQTVEHWIVDHRWLSTWREHPKFKMVQQQRFTPNDLLAGPDR